MNNFSVEFLHHFTHTGMSLIFSPTLSKPCIHSHNLYLTQSSTHLLIVSGMYKKGEYDLAGFSVGAVKRSEILPKGIIAGDMLIGTYGTGIDPFTIFNNI